MILFADIEKNSLATLATLLTSLIFDDDNYDKKDNVNIIKDNIVLSLKATLFLEDNKRKSKF